jgi:ATP-dependent DNA helicase RecG
MRDVRLIVKGVTENGVKSILQTLRQKGLLKRIGPDKGGYWEVVGVE